MSPATATEIKSVSLVNISTEKWPPRQRTYFGSLAVRSPEPGEPYAITPIRSCTGVMDLGDKRMHEIFISAQEIAEDLTRELNGDSGEGSFHGVFVATDLEPTEAELADARRRLEEFQRRLVAAADLEWERTKNPMFITDLERSAARQLGLEKPWLYDPSPWPSVPPARRKSNRAWPSAELAGRFSTKKKLRATASALPKERAGIAQTYQQKQTEQGSQPSREGVGSAF